jgi:hypothetical protein
MTLQTFIGMLLWIEVIAVALGLLLLAGPVSRK